MLLFCHIKTEITNIELLEKSRKKPMESEIRKKKWSWIGHILLKEQQTRSTTESSVKEKRKNHEMEEKYSPSRNESRGIWSDWNKSDTDGVVVMVAKVVPQAYLAIM